MKPTKMRNLQIYAASQKVRSRQLGAQLSADLRKKHERRSIRVVVGDTVRVMRGEYTDVEGKVSAVSALSGRVAIEGVKKEKGQGEKFDVMIHASNVVVTSLNTGDSWRVKKLKEEAPAAAKTAGSTGADSAPSAEAEPAPAAEAAKAPEEAPAPKAARTGEESK